MTRTYLGIVTRRGLETLVPETEHAEKFLLRRVGRESHREPICCWAALSDQAARNVQVELHCGRYRQALVLLNAEAYFLGTILPDSDDADLFTAA
jgi:hypothetical protein